MKTLIVIMVVIFVIMVVFQSFTVMSANKTEEQQYTVIRKEKDFEIRFYPSATIATIHSNAKTYKELSGPGFRQLAGYSEKLRNLLKENGITAYGNCRYLGYNPPYQVVGRKNEIIVSVKWN
jgi:hypothetical protein